MVAKQFIADALMEIGILGADEALDPADADLGLRHLAALVDLLQADRLLLYTVTRLPFTLVPAKQVYTIGLAGADWQAARPLWLSAVTVAPIGQAIEYPVYSYIYRENWLLEPNKALTADYPTMYLYEPAGTSFGSFTFWPVPMTAATIAIATPMPLTSPLALSTDLVFPPGGYYEAWRLNLARRLQRPFFVPDDASLRADAEHALSQIRRTNDEVAPWSRADEAITGTSGYDIRSGWTR